MTSDAITTLNYFVAPSDGSRPYTDISGNNAAGKLIHNWGEDSHDMQVEDVRGKEELYKLDNAGFQYGREAPKHTSFLNDDEIEREYYPESIDLIKRVTGATKVVIFDHTIRRRRPGESDDNPQKRQPVSRAHVDQTPAASIARVHRHLPPAEAPSLLRRRFQIINLWRPISHAAVDWPLALCDFRSVDFEKDLMPVALIYPDREGETFGVRYNPNHQWKYLKAMTPEEFVLIKCADSIQDGSVARLTPHTAFQDPNTPEGAPLRESIEVRTLVFYD
ncbi:uncharacterized protein F5891DRAFT_955018 [Suillus fuscotomentosus]|uniref:Methyltransferase n=1 Tax=Suillus fuscotomentosus TaxID=1912939 RepID=A0AAD4HJD1_9AGAM|nr:uncharacterized protein F5891DRAFT_955018 [Suillus fuscotomentosus]KAG1898768.1 hypothetical protein F5891DRAFT_955018 [Suillus fuscotomentosus]